MKRRLAAALFLLISLAFWLAGQRRNPPAFYLDESSVAYNALTIAERGVDEHGAPFPLFFRAFGEYKNPVFIYVLAGVFKVTSPETLTARRAGALLGWLAAVALGALAWRMTRRTFATVATFLTALATPMLFELSRTALEVAAFPLAIALFLLAARAAHDRVQPGAVLTLALAASLALIAYTYTSGRVLAIIFGLALFATRLCRKAIVATLVFFTLAALVPMAIYNARHDGALTIRARETSFVKQLDAPTAARLARNYALNALALPFRGDPNERHHVRGSGGAMLLMTFVLAALAIRRDRWTFFLALCAAASVLPAAVTDDLFHTYRLAAYPILLIALSIPALERIRPAIVIVLAMGVLQAGYFFTHFHRYGRDRLPLFDHGARQITRDALAQPSRPVYIRESPVYVHFLWFAALQNTPAGAFARIAQDQTPPPGSVIVGLYGVTCDPCTVISRHGDYAAFRTPR